MILNMRGRGKPLKQIKDCNGHTVCYIDEATGYIEASYKRQTTSTYLSVGRKFQIKRNGAKTIITRVSETKMIIERYPIAA